MELSGLQLFLNKEGYSKTEEEGTGKRRRESHIQFTLLRQPKEGLVSN
jgi:hypothetical protein